jgi:hypothetical protein
MTKDAPEPKAKTTTTPAPKDGAEGGIVTGWAQSIIERAPWVLAFLVAVVGLVPTIRALYAQTFAVLGRDQGIFQYVAWALRNGDRAYRDIHEINGPLPHAWYILMQRLGGEDEHVFRSIDTALLVVVYALAGSTLPRWVGLELGERKDRFTTHASWIAASLTILGAQYSRYDWWHTAQREELYALLVFGSLALQSIGQTTKSPRTALLVFALAGMTTTLPWFGKPPCAVFTGLQCAVLVLDRKRLAIPLKQALLAAAAGAVVVGLGMLAFLLSYSDIGRGIDLLSKVPRLHHTIWNEDLRGLYRAYRNGPRLDWALATFVAFVAVFRLFDLPRRALLGFVLPIGGFSVFAGQGKGFPYHLHMLTLGTGVLQLLIAAALARALQRGWRTERATTALAFVASLAAVGLGAKAMEDASKSPGIIGKWTVAGATPEKRTSETYLERFPWGDFSAKDLRDAANYLTFHTEPTDRIQVYGFDPYLLFLARRKSASPVIYSFELNVDAALAGGKGARPTPELRDWLLAYRDEAEALVLRSAEAEPPAAFALIDRAPFTHPANAERDFEAHCPKLYQWMTERYERGATFGIVRIWLRTDIVQKTGMR